MKRRNWWKNGSVSCPEKNCDMPCVSHVSYSEAFDNMKYSELFQTLNMAEFSPHFTALIQSLYKVQKALTRWNGAHTDPIQIGKM